MASFDEQMKLETHKSRFLKHWRCYKACTPEMERTPFRQFVNILKMKYPNVEDASIINMLMNLGVAGSSEQSIYIILGCVNLPLMEDLNKFFE